MNLFLELFHGWDENIITNPSILQHLVSIRSTSHTNTFFVWEISKQFDLRLLVMTVFGMSMLNLERTFYAIAIININISIFNFEILNRLNILTY